MRLIYLVVDADDDLALVLGSIDLLHPGDGEGDGELAAGRLLVGQVEPRVVQDQRLASGERQVLTRSTAYLTRTLNNPRQRGKTLNCEVHAVQVCTEIIEWFLDPVDGVLPAVADATHELRRPVQLRHDLQHSAVQYS